MRLRDQAEEYIREIGLKCTQGRVLVLATLMQSKKPLAIEAIQRKTEGYINPVTVYRILNHFAEKGLVYQTDFRTGKAYFEFQNNHHHHLVCTGCGRQEEIDICVDRERVMRRSKYFKAVHGHVLEFFGMCKKCAHA
jgi:Fe2+ or Zn2+ uptake regulation protein